MSAASLKKARAADWSQWTDGLHRALSDAKGVIAQSARGRGLTSAQLDQLMRSFHLIKGFAQALGLHGVQAVSHHFESRLLGTGQNSEPELGALLAEGIRRLDAVVERLHEVDLRAAAIRELALGARSVPSAGMQLSGVFSRIESAARGIALDLGYRLQFECRTGGAIGIQSEWEAPVEAALLHAVRNSLDHGQALSIQLTARLEKGDLVIECLDTGAGIDPALVREAARVRQARFDAEMGGMSDDEVLQLLFLPGLSLSRGVSRLSGRGYGLDIVREAIEVKLGGHARIESTLGRGTRLILRFPARS